MGSAFLACDWGTTNLRAWRIGEDGRPQAEKEFPLGVGRLNPGEAQARFHDTVRPALEAQGLPAVLCGMIGSDLGWRAVEYLSCPTGLQDLTKGLAEVEPGVRIAPGLKCAGLSGQPDVMRGEETQVLGWLAQDPARSRGVRIICHPGTHAKWVRVEDGRIVRFVTAMTGDLFNVLSQHSVLKSDAPSDDEAGFDAGVDAVEDGSALIARLFTARSRVTAGGASKASATSYLSGLLIGTEAAELPGLVGAGPADEVALIGDRKLCGWYARALHRRGLTTTAYDGEAAVLSGLGALMDPILMQRS